MKKLAILILAVGCGRPADKAPVRVIRDLTGATLEIPVKVERIVSVVPSATELVFAAGAGDLVVGVTTFCEYPPEAARIAKIGDMRVNYEAIVALKPDLIVSANNLAARTNEQLRGLGLRVLCLDPQSLADIGLSIRLLGEVTGRREAAEKAASDFDRRVSSVLERVKNVKHRPTVYLEASSTPHAAAPGMTGDEIIRLAGGTNVITETHAGKWIPISWELVLSRDPEFVIVAHDYTPFPWDRTGWSGLRASKKEKLKFDKGEFMYPTPRLAAGLERLARLLHPECFDEKDR
ncbi:MAG TPA: helical backbone metal receptor [Planctomycetota bacterium]|nr:helical backbone metal receptor [Planctomycetota bacterium]